MRRRRVRIRDLKAKAAEVLETGGEAATKADLFMDWALAQAEEIDELLDDPEELGAYLWDVFRGFVKAATNESGMEYKRLWEGWWISKKDEIVHGEEKE